MYTQLLMARALAQSLGGLPMLTGPLRRLADNFEGSIVVNDFDGDLKFELDLKSVEGSDIFWKGSHATHVLKRLRTLCKRDQTMVELGSRVGEVALFAAKRVGSRGRVVCVEPDEEAADRLSRNLDLNGFDHVDVLRMNLGERVRGEGASTLDALLDEGWFKELHVLKVDGDRADVSVLKGGEQVIEGLQPWVVITGGSRRRDTRERLAAFTAALKDLGYRLSRIDGGPTPLPFDGRPPFGDVIGCPPGKSLR
ncbi:MAG: hypothetical protein KTR31_36770 [Myxococcales bacterium]|nr:hypothetical protein [Myxococcales bacterium]